MGLRYGQGRHHDSVPGVNLEDGDSDRVRIVSEALRYKRNVNSGGDEVNNRRKIVRLSSVSRDQYFSDLEESVSAEGDYLSSSPLVAVLSTNRGKIYSVTRSEDGKVKNVMAEIRAVLAMLISSLEELNLTNIDTYSRILCKKPFWDGVALLIGVDVASSSPSEIRDILRSVHENALRASRVVVPNKSTAFKMWLSRNITHGSLRRNIMVAMGEKLARSDFKTRNVQADIERMTGEAVDFDMLVCTMQQLRTELSGREFSLDVRPSGEGNSVFHNLVPAHPSYPVEVVDEEMMLQSFGESFFDVLKDGRARKIYDVLAKNGRGNRIDSRIVAIRAFGVESPPPKFMHENFFSPLSVLVYRIENEWKLKLMNAKVNRRMERGQKVCNDNEVLKNTAENEFTIRRMRHGRGSQLGLDLSIENRLEAMEKWIAEMASPGSLLEKILWIMFGAGLDTKFTKYNLAELLAKDGIDVTEKQVINAIVHGTKGGGRLTKKSQGTLFEVNSRRGAVDKKDRDGRPISNAFHYYIRP